MNGARKQRWQQATALVSLSTAGAMTGITFAHATLADITSPTSMPAQLLAFKRAARPVSAGDGALRSAIVSAAQHYLRLAQGQTPAEMEALIWQSASTDGADHGESCAAFASLALEAGAQATGQQSWVTGGTSYPWPLHGWADVRVDPNPQSLGVVSILQDAEAHQRWHPLGDGYSPQPGDWVLFAGHVEVVTKYIGGVLYTIGGDSMPNLSVNAHQYGDPLSAQGVTGFVNNGQLLRAVSPATAAAGSVSSPQHAPTVHAANQEQADIPGMVAPTGNAAVGALALQVGPAPQSDPAPHAQPLALGTAAIPGAQLGSGTGSAAGASHRYGRSQVAPQPAQAPATAVQQSFIQQVAAGAIAAQRQYGVPAAVTIAQAIDESGWGQSQLAAQDNNLFGIKGAGPAGSVLMPTQEYENGQWVTVDAPFRVYNSITESINDHGLLLATGSSYKQAMADRADPDTFANDLTGVYATDPNYGVSLINLMRLYNLYRYDTGTHAAPQAAAPASPALGPAAQGGPRQSGASGATGSSVAATQGVAGYGPALGGAGGAALSGASGAALGGAIGAAGGNEALQNMSSRAAAIPGAAGPIQAQHVRAPATSASQRAVGHRSSGDSEAEEGASPSISAEASRARQNAADASGTRRSAATSSAAPAAQRAVTAGGSGLATAGGRSTLGTSGVGVASAGPAAPGLASPGPTSPGSAATGPARPSRLGDVPAGANGAPLGGARIPGVPASTLAAASQPGADRPVKAGPRSARISTRRYVPQMPNVVTTAFITSAKTPLLRSEPMYREVASDTGLRWQLLAACDWMQCRAQPRVSPVYGEKLGTKNPDGTVYRTKPDALKQCAHDLIILAGAVYGIELTQRLHLSVRDLARVFAAFRWGGLLAAHHVSALEFPYSVEGLTAHHIKMRWPDIPEAPGSDKPGTRFPMAFGAVPVVLGLDYKAVT